MKTYILRDTQTVQRQARVEPPATAGEILGRPARPTNGPVLFLGLDVHTGSIAVSLAPSDSTEVRRYGIIGGSHDDVDKLVKKLAQPGIELRLVRQDGRLRLKWIAPG